MMPPTRQKPEAARAGAGSSGEDQAANSGRGDGNEPWQLRMFRRTIKKQQKVKEIGKLLGDLGRQACLLVTCGDNNGAMNWKFKQMGGRWSWADAEGTGIQQITELTGDAVAWLDPEKPTLPYADGAFDTVVAIDVHEHLEQPAEFNRELARVTTSGGRVIVSTPNGDERKLGVRIKNQLGMSPTVYGHFVVGYDVPELEAQLQAVGVTPYAAASYSRFFSEMLELGINFAYVKLLRGDRAGADHKPGIAPQTQEQLRSVGGTYRLYSWIYPLFWAISRLDALIPFGRGYAVIVAGRKIS